MKISIDPAEVEFIDRPSMDCMMTWASYRGHKFEFCSLGYSSDLFPEAMALQEVALRSAQELAAEQLKLDIDAMSAHQRLAFLAATQGERA